MDASIVKLIFTFILLTAIAIGFWYSRKNESVTEGVFASISSIILTFILWVILSSISNFFSFDLVRGGDRLPSYSNTREESIKRKTYVSDVKLIVVKKPDSMYLDVSQGWIEKSWASGYWFWTTHESIGNLYHVSIPVKDIKGTWNIYHEQNQDYLHFDSSEMELRGNIHGLIGHDTITYSITKNARMRFEQSDVIGKLILIPQPK
jgi:hypothetical protein